MPTVEAVRRGGHGVEELHRINEVSIVVLISAQVLASQLQPQVAGKDARAVAETSGIDRLPRVLIRVDHGATELGVVAPRTAIQVVASYAHPNVVDDADLRVYVDRDATTVFEPVDGNSITARATQ